MTITPTYSGCPAMDADPRRHRGRVRTTPAGDDVDVEFVLAPAWTTDWMTDDGQAQAARTTASRRPQPARRRRPVSLTLSVRCPQCGSRRTPASSSRFGSTACKSLWVCRACREPFDHFKAI